MKAQGILITGGTGFVGQHLVPKLLSAGRHLTLAVRNAGTCPRSWRDQERITIVETGPLEAAANLSDALTGISIVIHMAGLAHVHHSDGQGENAFTTANATATGRLAQAALKSDVVTFIHMSSLFAVTDNVSLCVVDDETDRMPSTAYGRSKRMAEKYMMPLPATGVVGISLRPPLIIGADAGGNWGALQRIAASGLPLPFASVRNRRSMVAAETIASAVEHLCTREWPIEKSGSYCIADHGTISLCEIISELRQGMGMPPRLFPFPAQLIHGTAWLVRQQRRVAGMLGNLEVDASRFLREFQFSDVPSVQQSVRESGLSYIRHGAGRFGFSRE